MTRDPRQPLAILIRGGHTAGRVAQQMVLDSRPFKYEPWPNDGHTFTVKREHESALRQFIAECSA